MGRWWVASSAWRSTRSITSGTETPMHRCTLVSLLVTAAPLSPLVAQNTPLEAFRGNIAAIHARDRAAYLSHYLHTPALARVGPDGLRQGYEDFANGRDAGSLRDAVVVLRDGRIACAGSRAACPVPADADSVNAAGKWIIPGLIDTHVHFSQTGWVDGRPDALDLRDRYPYEQVEAELHARPDRFYRSYLCSGVTSVFDVGGYPWTLELQQGTARSTTAPRVVAAGPLLSTIDFWLNLPDQRQFIYMADEATVRAAVQAHKAWGAAAIKVWYIMPPQPPDTSRVSALVHAAGNEARKVGLPLIVHATGLWEAKDAVRAGARVLVHSVWSGPVDEAFLTLA